MMTNENGRGGIGGWWSWIAALIVAAAVPGVQADVRLPHVLGSHMVVQRERPIPIWGWADPDEEVTVTCGGQNLATKADAAGAWSVTLAALPVGGPHDITVAGKNEITLSDVLVGEVWLCSGQSNMEWGIRRVERGEEEIAAANYPAIRLFHLPWKTAARPQTDVEAQWRPCTPDNVSTGGFMNGGFSGVAYFFGRQLHGELGVPIGLIQSTWGGTLIEPWTPPVGLTSAGGFAAELARIAEAEPVYQKAAAEALTAYAAWLPAAQAQLAANKPVTAPPPWPRHAFDENTMPSTLYNGMIHPLVPFAIRGAIWYQGESNHRDGMRYRDRMQALVAGWRTVWNQGEFPFYFVQLAPYAGLYAAEELPRIWEAQVAALRTISGTGMAVTVDIGDLKDIHPKNKQEVGRRLALWALARTYGREGLVHSGPLYQGMTAEGKSIRITFEHVGGGLASRDGQSLTWFEIAGADRKFVPAQATIEGSSVIVSGEAVAEPVAVRFAWSDKAQPNLMNREGLPASPFRTDDWEEASPRTGL